MTQPIPRLWHCPPGSNVILAGELKHRTIVRVDRLHAIFADGAYASLCYPVDPACMQFGDGAGWRIRT